MVKTPPTIRPLLVADLLAEGERMPVYVHVIDHPDARVVRIALLRGSEEMQFGLVEYGLRYSNADSGAAL